MRVIYNKKLIFLMCIRSRLTKTQFPHFKGTARVLRMFLLRRVITFCRLSFLILVIHFQQLCFAKLLMLMWDPLGRNLCSFCSPGRPKSLVGLIILQKFQLQENLFEKLYCFVVSSNFSID